MDARASAHSPRQIPVSAALSKFVSSIARSPARRESSADFSAFLTVSRGSSGSAKTLSPNAAMAWSRSEPISSESVTIPRERITASR